MSMTPTMDNVIAVYRRATVEDFLEGKNWYSSTRQLCLDLDPHNVNRAAGIIAAFSPQCPWSRNVSLAREMYASNGTMEGGHTGVVLNKARAIWNGADPAIELGGKKTTSFYHNIVDPISAEHVTIDVHAFEIAIGHIDPKGVKALTRKGVYEEFSNAYRYAASLFNIPAPTMQAITWVRWKREKDMGILSKG